MDTGVDMRLLLLQGFNDILKVRNLPDKLYAHFSNSFGFNMNDEVIELCCSQICGHSIFLRLRSYRYLSQVYSEVTGEEFFRSLNEFGSNGE